MAIRNMPTSAGDARKAGSIPGSGRSPRVGNGNPLQYSCLENSMDRGAWQAIVHGVTKSLIQLSTHTPNTYLSWFMGALPKDILQSLGIIFLIVITVVSLVHCILSKVLNACSQPSAVHQKVSLHLEKQKQEEQ